MELYIKKLFSGRFSFRVLVLLLSMFSCVCVHSQYLSEITFDESFFNDKIDVYAMIVKYKDSDDFKMIELHRFCKDNAPKEYTYFCDYSCFKNGDFDEFQKYGFRIADKKIYVYDIENKKEHVAYDYNIQPGESFTTMDGREWLVVEKQDTVIVITDSFEKACSDKLVKIKVCLASDRSVTDEWLENFGSLHYGILNLHGDEIECSHVKFVEYEIWDEGLPFEYTTFDFAEDSIYGAYYGWLEGNFTHAEEEFSWDEEYLWPLKCKTEFKDGRLVVDFTNYYYNINLYYTAYRKGKELKVFSDELPPFVDGGSIYTNIKLTFDGLPTEDLDLNIFGYDVGNVTSISSIKAQDERQGGAIYDLTGRRVTSPEKGIYIQDGKKKLNK